MMGILGGRTASPDACVVTSLLIVGSATRRRAFGIPIGGDGRRADGFQRAYRVQAHSLASVRFYSICSFIRMNSAMAAAEAVGFVYSAKWYPSIIRT